MQKSTDHNMTCGARDAPQDVILRIKQKHVPHIVSGKKNHEYRDYILDGKVERVWLFVDELQTIQYILTIGPHKIPGEVSDPIGLGNKDFNEGLKEARFGYEILAVHKLPRKLGTGELLLDFDIDLVTRGKQYVKQALVDHYPRETLEKVAPETTLAE